MEEDVLQLYCKAADFDAATGTCSAPFYGPSQGLLPNLSAADGLEIAAGIITCWGIGFIIRSARKSSST